MPFVAAKSAVFKLDNAAGTLTDISTYIDDAGFPRTVDQPETTTFGKSSKTRIIALKDGSFSLKGPWDATLHTHMTGIYGLSATVSFEYGPAGGTTGLPKATGEARLSQYAVSTGVAGRVEWTATLACDGDVTDGTYA